MSEDEPKEIENEENIEFTEKEIIFYCKMFVDNANETFKKVQNDGCLSLSVYNSDIKAIQGLLDLYQKEKTLAENHKIAFEKQTENLHEVEDLYQKEKEKNKELQKENIEMETNIEQTVILSVKWSTNKAIIETLQNLLKKGQKHYEM